MHCAATGITQHYK